MDAISWSMQAVSILDNFNRFSKYKISIGASSSNSRIRALKFTESASTQQVSDEMPLSTDSLAWNTVIQTHLGNLDYSKAVTTYHRMLSRGVRPDRHTLPRILSVSRLSGSLSLGKQLHGHAVKLGVSNDVYVTGALIQLYGHLDGNGAAKWVLDNSERKMSSVSWTLLAKLYIMQNKPALAIDLFNEMVESGAEIDPVSLTTAISACVLLKSLKVGRNIHQTARKHGLELDLLMPSRDAISWTSAIQGYVKNGLINEGLKLFRKMITDAKIKPDAVAISSILPACARMAAHKNGREIHGYLVRNTVPMNLKVENALIDMYAKSGCLEYASMIFLRMKSKDVVSWTVMILGYSLHGQGHLGVELFQKIPTIDIDEISYVTALFACCTACMVEEGMHYFNYIKSPKLVHCTLMVTLLARAGKFDEARAFVEERSIAKHAEVVRALIDGCRIHRNLSTGKRLIEQLCDLEPLNADNYVMMSNWYAQSGKQDMVDAWRETIRDMNLTPKIAYSWIEFRNKVHVFRTGDVSHPRSEGIYWELEFLMKNLEGKGFHWNPDFSFHDIDEERECVPIGHSELLAISFGLISIRSGTTVRVTKNLRVCHSCHEAAKYISKVVSREIILKDPNCFHHFKNGICSCQDLY
ncbi:pentatricopeptide repeat-containing protein At3g12770-like [Cynara cardunculus var. scolymus]|uniref:pentatricopeptide repeat-containing protein At3g12770-like n=1 Tax=Cynara cardunculus var. scolymus TaxID=59895 RepID=UPI000D626804|nr:pentatricopeptide repeat-containing protein At3g12770-like [Cynara cardunculus var. scolymus]